ncbi:molybdopterin molybdotransferase MoeA [Yoonia litorea]|uniref:Molybdopterin molybdenumtransferase n=1 Tax=Yoonia litorea TaxID=1123755 RepID=A0A1I6MAL6_9RHOB|nr:gephyrin-like molybdotransferase Glp [Yoonia litorea]SFS12658.1 molybdopterin molybdotransferase [Yoonia litorea]
MITVADALAELFSLVTPCDSEIVPLRLAAGRVLAQPVSAKRTQPPFDASAMDGYALARTDVRAGVTLSVIGEAAAGHGFRGDVATGECVRIFTGAPLPKGTDHVIVQENVTRDGDKITLDNSPNDSSHVRAAGGDFKEGATLSAPRQLRPSDIALLAAMNIAEVPVVRKPVVAIIATGDELVQPGENPGPDQIIASNSYGLAAMVDAHGATARLLPIARDNAASLELTFDLAASADLIVTIGGASVGDHDIVAQVAEAKGLQRAFYKVAMRPGKPLMGGRIGTSAMLGLPGNPVSAMVCGHVFLLPMLRKMLGLGEAPALQETAILSHDLAENGPREHYMRGRVTDDGLQVFSRQDSALLSVLSEANCLAIRPPHDHARRAGDTLEIIKL